jgi:hypothetical protein
VLDFFTVERVWLEVFEVVFAVLLFLVDFLETEVVAVAACSELSLDTIEDAVAFVLTELVAFDEAGFIVFKAGFAE